MEGSCRIARVQRFNATRYGKDQKSESMRASLILRAVNGLGPVQRILDVGCGVSYSGSNSARRPPRGAGFGQYGNTSSSGHVTAKFVRRIHRR